MSLEKAVEENTAQLLKLNIFFEKYFVEGSMREGLLEVLEETRAPARIAGDDVLESGACEAQVKYEDVRALVLKKTQKYKAEIAKILAKHDLKRLPEILVDDGNYDSVRDFKVLADIKISLEKLGD